MVPTAVTCQFSASRTFCVPTTGDRDGATRRVLSCRLRRSRIPPTGARPLPAPAGGYASCDTPRVARKLRHVEQVNFNADDPAQIVAFMTRLTAAEDGWINLIPRINEQDERPTSLGFLTLLSGGSIGVTMATWVPGSRNRRGMDKPSLGITHAAGHRVFAELRALDVPIPATWFVEQDHPRRGLVLRVPPDESLGEVLAWALSAVGALGSGGSVTRWRADVYLPVTS